MAEPGGRLGRLTGSLDSDAAAWVPAALRGFAEGVCSIVPPVFDAYARVFHPATRMEDKEEVPVRWADVAEANGRTMHPAAEWGSIVAGLLAYKQSGQPGLWDQPPSQGELPQGIARRLLATLSEHTAQPDHAFFAVWEGFGYPSSLLFLFPEDMPEQERHRAEQKAQDALDARVRPWRELVDGAAAFEVPGRRMHLLSGPLEAIEDFYEFYNGWLSVRHPPSLWWPGDQAWCVGGDVDLMTSYVGASSAAIEALLADGELEAFPVPDTQGVTWDTDEIDPLPAAPH
jgi:hypothetical protein